MKIVIRYALTVFIGAIVFWFSLVGIVCCAHILKSFESIRISPRANLLRVTHSKPIRTIDKTSDDQVQIFQGCIQVGNHTWLKGDLTRMEPPQNKKNYKKNVYGNWRLECQDKKRYSLYNGDEITDRWVWKKSPTNISLHDYHIAVYQDGMLWIYPLNNGILETPIRIVTSLDNNIVGIAFVDHHLCIWSETQIQYVY